MNIQQLTLLSKGRFTGLLFGLVLMLMSTITLLQQGLNFGLDFTGGTLSEFSVSQPLSRDELTQLICPTECDNLVLTQVSADQFQLRQPTTDVMTWQQNLTEQGIDYTVLSSSFLGSQVGDELFEQGCLALFTAMVAVMLYLAVRFEWRLALGSVFALFHDLILVLGLFSLLGLEFNLTVLAALLAIIGYSLNDSIIVGDRVRELLRQGSDGKNINTDHVINDAIKSTLTRTLITSGTTLVTIASIWLLAGASLTGFAIALFCGIVVGTFSSICIAATLPQLLGLSAQNYRTELDQTTQAYMDMP